MSRLIMLLVCFIILTGLSNGQGNSMLNGVVLDERNQPLPGAAVSLSPHGKGTITDKNGSYNLRGLANGKYQIEISFIGYLSHNDSITISGNDRYDVRLFSALYDIGEVVVRSDLYRIRRGESPVAFELVTDDYLKKNLGGSLMKTLEKLPGISTIDIGSGQSKPVIRGLSFNRIAVTENGIKHEGQQWGADHGLEIDQYSVERVEVIRGPSSLLYGSDAIGGVLVIESNNVPADGAISGTVDMTAKSGNRMYGTSVSLAGRKESLYAVLRATVTGYADSGVPADSVDIYSYRVALHDHRLRNTAGNEFDLHFRAGFMRPGLHARLFLSNVHTLAGFFANAHGLEPRNVDEELHDASQRDIQYPFQEVNHFKAITVLELTSGKFSLESHLGFQNNFREEWSRYVNHGYMPAIPPDNLSFDPDLERMFNKRVWSGDIKLSASHLPRTIITTGISSALQQNRISGRGFIIPSFNQFTAGGYLLVRHTFSPLSTLLAGVRIDHGFVGTMEYSDWYTSPVTTGSDTIMQYIMRAESLSLQMSSFTWSAGYAWNPGNWSFKLNAGRSFRLPIPKELAANGVNYHNFSYEKGNPDLSPEVSYQLDVTAGYSNERLMLELNPYINYFPNYIFLNPGPEHDRQYGTGNQVFNYTQSRVLRAGGEFQGTFTLVKHLHLGLTGEYLVSRQLSGAKKGFSLPFSPPATVIFNVRYEAGGILFMKNPYLAMDIVMTSRQENIVPPEEPTDGYTVFNIAAGFESATGDNSIFSVGRGPVVSMQVTNLLNRKYFNHTSYYRLINLPEPGRSFILNITIPFSAKSFNNKSIK